MIDRVISAKGKDSFLDDYTADQAVVGSDLYNPNSSVLTVIFPPWHGGGRIVGSLIKNSLNTRQFYTIISTIKFWSQK
jgi:hypothetical protein